MTESTNELTMEVPAEADAIPKPETITVIKTKCDCCGAFSETTHLVDTKIGKKYMCARCHAIAVFFQ